MMNKKITLMMLAVLLVGTLTSCGVSSGSDTVGTLNESSSDADSTLHSIASPSTNDDMEDSEVSTEDTEQDALRTYSASFTLQTAKYDNTNRSIDSLTEKYEGYMDYEDQNQEIDKNDNTIARTRTVTLKIPTVNMESFIKELQQINDIYILNDNIYLEDVTNGYNTIDSDLEYFQALAEKYEKMFNEAETLDEISQIDDYYWSVLNQIDKLKQQKDEMTGQIAYSSVHIYVEEKSAYDMGTRSLDFAEQAATNFQIGWYKFANNVEDVILDLLSVWVYALIVIIIVIAAVILIVRYRKRSEKTEDTPKAQAKAEVIEPVKDEEIIDPDDDALL